MQIELNHSEVLKDTIRQLSTKQHNSIEIG